MMTVQVESIYSFNVLDSLTFVCVCMCVSVLNDLQTLEFLVFFFVCLSSENDSSGAENQPPNRSLNQ